MSADPDEFRRTSRLLVGAMLGVVVSFLASVSYSHHRLSNAAEALSIATNAAPSIRALSDARMHLHRLAFQLGHEVSVLGSSTAQAAVERERKLLGSELSSYFKLPLYQGEELLQEELRSSLEALDPGIASARERIRAGDLEGARALVFDQVGRVLDDVDDDLRALVEFNGNQLEAEATAIHAKQRRYNEIMYLLYGTSILIAALATLLVIRAVRRYFAVLDRRANELEYFAIQVGHDILNPLTAVLTGLRLAHDGATEDSLRHTLDRSLRGVSRIQEQIDRLRSFASARHERSPPDSRARVQPCLAAAAAALSPQDIVCEPGDDVSVRCTDQVLDRIVRAILSDALARRRDEPVQVRLRAGKRTIRLEVEGGAALSPRINPFAPRVRGPASGYPGIELAMLMARRLTEAHQGRVGGRAVEGRSIIFVELPRA